MVFEGFAGLLVFVGGVILMFLIVPRERIKELALIGVVGGLGVALVMLYLMQNVFGFWIFHRVDFVNIFKIPIFLAAGWIPIIIVFSHLLAQYKDIPLIGLILLAFPLGATFLHFLLLTNGMLIYSNWNLPLTLLSSFAIHLAILIYLYVTHRLENLPELK